MGWLLDDRRAGETAPHLHQAIVVRVVPEGAGVGRGERVVEASTRRDGGLGETGDAVHRVRQTDACQCTVVPSVSPFSTAACSSAPWRTRRTGPGTDAVIGPDPGSQSVVADHQGFGRCRPKCKVSAESVSACSRPKWG